MKYIQYKDSLHKGAGSKRDQIGAGRGGAGQVMLRCGVVWCGVVWCGAVRDFVV